MMEGGHGVDLFRMTIIFCNDDGIQAHNGVQVVMIPSSIDHVWVS